MNTVSIGRKEFFLQASIGFSVRILAAIAGFLVSLVIGRKLGANESGLYFLGFSVVSFLAALSRVGLDNTVLRFVGAAFPDKEWGCIRSILIRSLAVSLVVSSILAVSLYLTSGYWAVSVFGKPEMSEVFRSFSPGIVGLSLFTLLAMSLQGLRKITLSVLILQISVSICLITALFIFPIINAVSTALTYSAASFATSFLGLTLFFKSTRPGGGVVEWGKISRSCTPLLVVVLMQQLVQWSGQFIAGAWVEPDAVAQLAVAQRTAMLASFVLVAVNMVVAPRFAALYKQGDFIELERIALMSVRLMVLFAFPIVGVMLLYPGYLMSLFGEGFIGGSNLLQILALGQFVNVITGSVGFLLTMSGHERDMRNTVLVSGPLAVLLAVVFVPYYGSTGSAIATALSISTQNLFAVWYVHKRLGFNTLAVWKKM